MIKLNQARGAGIIVEGGFRSRQRFSTFPNLLRHQHSPSLPPPPFSQHTRGLSSTLSADPLPVPRRVASSRRALARETRGTPGGVPRNFGERPEAWGRGGGERFTGGMHATAAERAWNVRASMRLIGAYLWLRLCGYSCRFSRNYLRIPADDSSTWSTYVFEIGVTFNRYPCDRLSDAWYRPMSMSFLPHLRCGRDK